jgi:hypothetical protein
MFPRFRITRSDFGEFFGSVTATTCGAETWVGDGRVGYLMFESRPISGRWHVRGSSWGFTPDAHDAIHEIHLDTDCMVLDSYWGERAKLVLDEGRRWQKARYKGSDHDHCAICWDTLGNGGQPEGCVDDDATWICCGCHEAFVQRRSLDFITPK